MFPGPVPLFQNQLSFYLHIPADVISQVTSKQGPGGQFWWTAKLKLFLRDMWKHAWSCQDAVGGTWNIRLGCLMQSEGCALRREISVLNCSKCPLNFTIPGTWSYANLISKNSCYRDICVWWKIMRSVKQIGRRASLMINFFEMFIQKWIILNFFF